MQLPDSPRFLSQAGRHDEAWEVLVHVRGGETAEVRTEFAEMVEASKHVKRSNPLETVTIFAGLDRSGKRLGRRAWLSFFLQIMGSWTGITAVTVYSSVLFRQAGFSRLTQNGLSGGVNTIGIIGTIISAQIIDRFGRRKCLMAGAAGLALVNFIAAGLFEASRKNPDQANNIAPGAALMLFLFNLTYAATWGTLAFLIPTEIFPSEMRAQGNGFGILGWSVGCGWTTLINPTIFKSLENRAYFIFGALNAAWIIVVFLFYPETAERSLESIEALFTSSSPFSWSMERAYREGGDILANADKHAYALDQDSADVHGSASSEDGKNEKDSDRVRVETA